MNQYVELRVGYDFLGAELTLNEWAKYLRTLELDLNSLWQSYPSMDFPINSICIYSTTILIIDIHFLLPSGLCFFCVLQTVGNFIYIYICDLGAILPLY